MSNLRKAFNELNSDNGIKHIPHLCFQYGLRHEHTDAIRYLPCVVITVEDGFNYAYYLESFDGILFAPEDIRTVIWEQ